jgi:hypothetical protein
MKRGAIAGLITVAVVGLGLFLVGMKAVAQTALKVSYGATGIQQLTYNGVVLEDLNQYSSDAFHIWHMKVTDLKGNLLSSGQYGWGESNNGRQWDAGSHTWTYSFTWGTISVQFVQNANNLDMNVTEKNLSNSGVIVDGAVIYPFALHFPQLPVGFSNAAYPQLAFNTIGPSVTVANFGSGEVVAVVPSAAKALYSGFQPTGQGNSYTPIISGTSLDGMATFQPHNDRPVSPGQTDTYTVSLRFAPAGQATTSLAADAYQSWAATWPAQVNWADRRVIGTVYMASSAQGNVNQPAGYPNNPRRYFNNGNASDFDVRTTAGLAAFQARVLQQAANNVANLQRLNAQGAITWDIEGQQYPQETSYVCSPDQIAQVAPEMESVVSDRSSAYAGMKLDDAYFKIMRDAGFRVGVCIRPQHFTLNGDGTAQQVYLPNGSIAAELIRKMKYAHDRWGATLFYVDSTVESNGAVLDAGIFQQVAAALPDSLISPEEMTPKYYAYTAPFRTFIFHGDLGTDAGVYNYYPKAFSLVLVNDVDAGTLAANIPALTKSVRNGDILMTHVDYWQENNPTILKIYQSAGVGGGTTPVPVVPTPVPPIPVTPTPVTPDPPITTTPPAPVTTPAPVPNPPASVYTSDVVITTPAPNETVGGIIGVVAQVNTSLDAAGSYLMIDGTAVGTRRVTSGPYVYPLDTSQVANGQHTLQVWAHNTGNSTILSSPVVVTVSNSDPVTTTPAPITTPIVPVTTPTPVPVTTTAPVVVENTSYPITLTYPVSGQALSGSISVSAAIGQTLDAAGSYLMVDGVEIGTRRVGSAPYLYELDTITLSPGQHVLQIFAHDTGNNNLLSNQAAVIIASR